MTSLVTTLKKATSAVDAKVLAVSVMAAAPVISFAQNTGSIAGFDNAKNTAGSKKLDDSLSNTDRLFGNAYNTMTTAATFLGVLLVAISLWQLYKASKEERESPKSAVVGLIVGGLLTAVGLVTAFSRNTLTL